MSIQVNCSAAYGTLGSLCKTKNNIRMIVALALTTPNFKFDSAADFADRTKWDDGVKSEDIFILKGVQEIDDQSQETKFYEPPTGKKVKMQEAVYGFEYRFLMTLEQHKQLQKFDGQELRYFKFDSANNILGWESPIDKSVRGFAISDFSTENMVIPSNNDVPALSPLSVTENDRNEWNLAGRYVAPLWMTSGLKSLAPVELIVASGTATEVKCKVYYDGGLSADGHVNAIGIEGLITGDFEFLTATGSSQTITVNEDADGNYTLTGTALETGTLSLVTPPNLSDGLLIVQKEPTIVTIP